MASTYVEDLAEIAALIDTGAPLDAVKIALYTAGPAPSPNMVLADFTLATFTGATPKAVTWGTPYQGPDMVPAVDSQLLAFSMTGGVIIENVVGMLVTDTGGTKVLYAMVFEAPIPIFGVGAGFSFVFTFRRYDTLLTQVP